MMTEEERIEWLLELQEHPEQLTDDQLKQILADDEMRQLVQQLGFAKRAFKHDELKDNPQDMDDEWEKFAASHANELTNAARAEGKLACTMPCKEEEDEVNDRSSRLCGVSARPVSLTRHSPADKSVIWSGRRRSGTAHRHRGSLVGISPLA